MHRSLKTLIMSLLSALVLSLSFALMQPTLAFARSYEISNVDIDATIHENGSLEVVETRTFDFDGNYNGVFWDIPQAWYDGRELSVELLSAGVIEDGTYHLFTEGYDEQNGTYEVNDFGSAVQLKIFRASQDESVVFRMSYLVEDALSRGSDVAVLYWKFVSDGWDVESQDVHLRIHLPVPSNQRVVPGENVRAWGHGPLDATVSFDQNDVICDVVSVGTEEFAEIRLTMPADWVREVEPRTEELLPDILEEEKSLAEAANTRRAQAERRVRTFSLAAFVAPLLAAVSTISVVVRIRNLSKTNFNEQYFRDVPTDDHPAVLGSLYNGGTPQSKELTATLMRLSDQKYFSLSPCTVEKKGLFGSTHTKDDYCLRFLGERPMSSDESSLSKLEDRALQIDQEAYDFVSYASKKGPLARADGIESCYFSDFDEIAEEHSEAFERHYTSWQEACEEAYKERFKSGAQSKIRMGYFVVMFIFEIMAAIAILAAGLIFDMVLPAVPAFIVLIFCALISIFAVSFHENLNEEGVEVKAKLIALKRWLKDFTRLDEALPSDIVLWNRLLIMAVVLGVADDVIKQLQIAMPQIFEAAEINPIYQWYHTPYESRNSAMKSFTSQAAAAHSLSEGEISSSDWSSGSGGGGGFSSGGGGGFGGGGGGGAF